MTEAAAATEPTQAAGAATEVAETPSTTAASGPRLSRAERLAAVREKAEKEDAAPAAQDAASDGQQVGADAAQVAPAKKEEPSEAATTKEGDDGKKPEAEKKPSDDKINSRFASLARKEADLQRGRTEHGASIRAFETAKQQHEQAHTARAADLDKREGRIKEREEADHLLLSNDPLKILDRLDDLGIKTRSDLNAAFEGRWKERRAVQQRDADASKPVKPEEKPLTQADVDRIFKEKQEAASREANQQKAYADFITITEATDDKGNDKFPAAQAIWSRRQRIAKANDIANALIVQGAKFTHEDVADALNILAEDHPRWQRWNRRSAKVGAADSQTVAGTPAKTVQDSAARNGQPGQSTPVTKETPKPPAAASQMNGTQPLNYREARKQRIANLSKDKTG